MNTTVNKIEETKPFKVLFFFITILPISLFLGSAIINVITILVNLIFLYILTKEKKIILNNKFSIYILLIFWISLLVNLFNSLNIENSLSRTVGFARFVLLSLAVQFLLENCSDKKRDKFFLIWIIIFLIISFDLIIEFIFGINLSGNRSLIPGRLSGFMGNELKIGNYYTAFCLLALSFFYYKLKKKKLIYIFIFLTIFISFSIGERSNFIKLFIILAAFLFLFNKKNFIIKILFITSFIASIILFISFNSNYKNRFWTMFGNEIMLNKDITKTINNSPYGGHWNAAWEIFKDHKVFGVGIKNFRLVSGEPKYYNKNVLFSKTRQNTHPHQIHLEFLSETGLFGYFFFLLMIISTSIIGTINYLKNKNLYQLSSLLYFLSSTILFIPSGSFFTTYSATIFWLLFGIIMVRTKKNYF